MCASLPASLEGSVCARHNAILLRYISLKTQDMLLTLTNAMADNHSGVLHAMRAPPAYVPDASESDRARAVDEHPQ